VENGFSKYPQQDGRFPQISGFRVVMDPAAPPGRRVVSLTMNKTDAPVDVDATYTLACTTFLASGKDGYDVLAAAPRRVCAEQGAPRRGWCYPLGAWQSGWGYKEYRAPCRPRGAGWWQGCRPCLGRGLGLPRLFGSPVFVFDAQAS
jgi:hypothetical protein